MKDGGQDATRGVGGGGDCGGDSTVEQAGKGVAAEQPAASLHDPFAKRGRLRGRRVENFQATAVTEYARAARALDFGVFRQPSTTEYTL